MSAAVPDRPLTPLISALVNAAHETHQQGASSTKRLQQPDTQQYAMFKWQLQEAAEATQQQRGSNPPSRRTSSIQDAKRISNTGSTLSFAMDEGGQPTANLEISCEYDANFQNADLSGQQGQDVRPTFGPNLGPVAFLFRWYTKRATQFPPGFPLPEDLVDSPAMLPPDPLKPPKRVSVTGGSGGGGGGAPVSAAVGTAGTAALSTGALGTRLSATVASTRTSLTGDVPVTSTSSPQQTIAASGGWNDGLPAHGGHSLNRAPDPVMSLTELNEMLEELEFVPKSVSRADVAEAFKAALQVRCDPPNKLPCGQVRPDELRYPQFCDALIRLALAADAKKAQAAGAAPGSPANAVLAMMGAMDVTSPNLAALKRKLDALARMAGDRGAKRNAIKWMYVNPQSAMDAARALCQPVGPSGWTVDSRARAPQELVDALMGCDAAASQRYLPSWKRFPEPALNLGSIRPGELRCLRVVLRNRAPNTMYIRVDTSGAAGFLTCAFKELPLPSGVPRVLDVQAQFEVPGEYMGNIQIYSRIKQEGVQCLNCVPFYALVVGVGPDARFPRTKGERGVMAASGAAVDGMRPTPEAVSVALSAASTPQHSFQGSIVARSQARRSSGADYRPDSGYSYSGLSLPGQAAGATGNSGGNIVLSGGSAVTGGGGGGLGSRHDSLASGLSGEFGMQPSGQGQTQGSPPTGGAGGVGGLGRPPLPHPVAGATGVGGGGMYTVFGSQGVGRPPSGARTGGA